MSILFDVLSAVLWAVVWCWGFLYVAISLPVARRIFSGNPVQMLIFTSFTLGLGLLAMVWVSGWSIVSLPILLSAAVALGLGFAIISRIPDGGIVS